MNDRRVAIVGVGYSDVGRHTGRSARHHAAQAALRALADAGLTVADVDGAASLGGTHDLNFELLPDMTHSAPVPCAATLWSRTSLTPADVDTAQLYDGFSVITFLWLEALGLVEPGAAGPFIAAGETRLGGRLPVNTDRGACNVGRRHGANFCIEAVRQLRGQSGARQVPGAEVAVWANAVGPFAGAMLLTSA